MLPDSNVRQEGAVALRVPPGRHCRRTPGARWTPTCGPTRHPLSIAGPTRRSSPAASASASISFPRTPRPLPGSACRTTFGRPNARPCPASTL
eukprot:7825318-Lingulodinium_polyedra.AAC.1